MNDETISLVRDVAARLRQQAVFASTKSERADCTADAEAIESMLDELERRTVDDETLVDEAWLRSVGFDCDDPAHSTFLWVTADFDDELQVFVHRQLFTVDFELCGNGGLAERKLPHATRGQVRRLCEALGIKTKEVV